jgi:hypothetical protein
MYVCIYLLYMDVYALSVSEGIVITYWSYGGEGYLEHNMSHRLKTESDGDKPS